MAHGSTHSQRGTAVSHHVGPFPWFPEAGEIEGQAFAAGEAAFWQVINSESGRMG